MIFRKAGLPPLDVRDNQVVFFEPRLRLRAARRR